MILNEDNLRGFSANFNKLAAREELILQLLIRGVKPGRILEELEICRSTYDTYIKRIKKKLNVNHSNELVLLAYAYFKGQK